ERKEPAHLFGRPIVDTSATSQIRSCSRLMPQVDNHRHSVTRLYPEVDHGTVKVRSFSPGLEVFIAYQLKAASPNQRQSWNQEKKPIAGPISCLMAVTSSSSVMQN